MGILALAWGACEKQAPPASAPAPVATKRAFPPARSTPTELPEVAPRERSPGADDRDAPNAPAALPRSYDLAGWLKYDPVRVGTPADLDSLVGDENARAAMGAYRLKSVAHCVYRYMAPGTKTLLLLDVLWVEAMGPDDAFGLFSVLTPPPRTAVGDGSRTGEYRDSDGGIHLLGWQGDVFVQMTTLADDDRGTLADAARTFRAKLLFGIPRADPPELVRRLPPTERLPGCEWLIRRASVLRLPGAVGLPPVDAGALAADLGLDGNVLLAIAGYEVARGEPPNYVWVAEYGEPSKAAEAAGRYQTRIAQSKDEVGGNTMLGEASGRFVVGTWTADQESVQHLLPRLIAGLPR